MKKIYGIYDRTVEVEFAKKDEKMVTMGMSSIDNLLKCWGNQEAEHWMTSAYAQNDLLHTIGLLETEEWWKVGCALRDIKLHIAVKEVK